jgi:hypothetical protein
MDVMEENRGRRRKGGESKSIFDRAVGGGGRRGRLFGVFGARAHFFIYSTV